MNSTIKSAMVACVLLASVTGFPDAQADAARGVALYASRCSGCHSVDFNRTGPLHRGVVGRRVGGVTSYRYSPALSGKKTRLECEVAV